MEKVVPKNIKIATWILYFAQAIGLIKQYLHYINVDLRAILLNNIPSQYMQLISNEQLEQLLVYYKYAIYAGVIVSFLGMIYVIYETSLGKNWARVLLLISCILTYILLFGASIFTYITNQGFDFSTFVYRIIVSLLEIFALILLFSKNSKSYFTS